MEKRLQRLFQIITLASSLVSILVLVTLLLTATNPGWKNYQRRYLDMLRADFGGERKINITKPALAQITIKPINRVDRCTSCHVGIDNPAMSEQPLPFRRHSGDYLEHHPPQKFGCTICHNGQGRAVTKREAHADDPSVRWAEPLLQQKYLQSSCGKCHLAIFTPSPALTSSSRLLRGLELFNQEGCLGCHKARGVGGSKGPDLSSQGSKTVNDYNFENVKGERTVANWLYSHFKDPAMVSPGSQMLSLTISDDELDDLITFTMGMNKPPLPLDYFSVETLQELKGRRNALTGEQVYSRACSACHGKKGEGKSYTEFKWGVPSIGSQDFRAAANADLLRRTLQLGRSGRMMDGWTPRFSGFKPEELQAVLSTLLSQRQIRSSWEETTSLSPNRQRGKQIYATNCAMCHGNDGRGLPHITLSNQSFLSNASDAFLYQTIINGRATSGMPAWGALDSQDMADLLAWLRQWQTAPSRRTRFDASAGNVKAGDELYHYRCSRCHGVNGEGQSAPAIGNSEFLSHASDGFIAAMVQQGREHTAMFGWSKDVTSSERLTREDIADIITYLRTQALQPQPVLRTGAVLGNAERGTTLFAAHCVECHGENGEGTKAPALNNQEFLNSATNGFLLATITLGRRGTAMPSWGRGAPRYPALSVQERLDIVAAIRQWQKIKIQLVNNKADR